jgi:predicted dehydrogenase
MSEKIRWGILSTGNIASKFAAGLQALDDVELVAVGSRSQASADAFAGKFGARKGYDSYEALAADPEIDAVYIGSPHPFHTANTLLCLEAGKAVICEKPFAMNARDAKTMVDLARQKQLFLMEAMWTRYFPVMVRVRELLAQEVIGEVRMVEADFGFRTNFNPSHRLFAPELGGGALLDVGIYPTSFAYMVLGQPQSVTSLAHLGETGVDENSAMLFKYANGALAVLSCAVRTETPQVAIINGTKGRITVNRRWWMPRTLTLEIYGEEEQHFDLPPVGNGYNYEAAEVGRCLRAGLLESEIMPLDETLKIMHTLDEIRAQWGLTYPME